MARGARRRKKRVKKKYDYSRNKYLGKRVEDVGKPGLDSVKEFKRIKEEILKDYRKGVIDARAARGRLLNLYRLTYKSKNSKIRHLSNKTLIRLRAEIKEAMHQVV